MLFAADVTETQPDELVREYWAQLSDFEMEEEARDFASRLAKGALAHMAEVDERIRSRAEHWRISRMAIVDRNILRLAVYEFLHEPTPHTVAINEALEIARRFSSYEATQFINGILDAIKNDLDQQQGGDAVIEAAATEDEPDAVNPAHAVVGENEADENLSAASGEEDHSVAKI
jgi:N utilization substance protein B